MYHIYHMHISHVSYAYRVCITCLPSIVLHIDGKHKLHHGKWILVSIGCHDIKFDQMKQIVVHSYRPFVYQFVKQQESQESVRMLCTAVDFLAFTRFGVRLQPGVVNMDHSSGFRTGVLDVWPNAGAGLEYRSVSHGNVLWCATHILQEPCTIQYPTPSQVSIHAGRISSARSGKESTCPRRTIFTPTCATS